MKKGDKVYVNGLHTSYQPKERLTGTVMNVESDWVTVALSSVTVLGCVLSSFEDRFELITKPRPTV